MFKIGCHVSVSGGYEMMGKTTLAIGGNTFQYFTRNPRGSRGTKAPSPSDVEALRILMEENGFAPALAHAPYTYNPASKDENIRQYTKEAMAEELRFLEYSDGFRSTWHVCTFSNADAAVGYESLCLLFIELVLSGAWHSNVAFNAPWAFSCVIFCCRILLYVFSDSSSEHVLQLHYVCKLLCVDSVRIVDVTV